jgi:predicted small secreted protein
MNALAILITVLALTACNTVSGIGKDMTGTAEWTKEQISKKESGQK